MRRAPLTWTLLPLVALGLLPAPAAARPPAASQPAAERRPPFCELTPCLDTPVTRQALTRDTRFGRVLCKKGREAGLDDRGRLVFCNTARKTTLDGLRVAGGAYTLFHPNGRVYQTTVTGAREIVLANGTRVRCGPGLVALTPDGVVTYCRLGAPLEINGVACRAGEGIAWRVDGRLSGATLDRPFSVGAVGAAAGGASRAALITFPPGSSLSWDAQGVLKGGRLPVATRAQGLVIRSTVGLHPNGRLHAVTLAEATILQGHKLPASAELELRPDGTLVRASYVEHLGAMPHGELTTETRHLTFDRGGAITSSRLERWQSPLPHRPLPWRGRR